MIRPRIALLRFSSALGVVAMLAITVFAQAQSNTSGALVVPTPSAGQTNVAEPVLRDIKAPVEIPDYWLYLWVAIGVVVAGVIGFLLWKFWLKKKFAPVPVAPLPPHVRAKRRLREAMAYINEPTKFTVFVSDTLRVYLEEQFSFRAPERTTEEFLHELGATRLLTDAQKKSLGEFLSRCDLIKFAKYDPTKPELEQMHQAALNLIEETEPKPMSVSASGQPSVATTPK